MMVSGRQAARSLRDVLSSDEQVRLLLRSGVAGPGTTTPGGVFFDEDEVQAVRLRPNVDKRALAPLCPHGLLVARLPRTAALDVTSAWRDVACQVARAMREQRPMTPLTAGLLGVRIRTCGSLPFAATFLGLVVLTAEVAGFDAAGPKLEPPGPWAKAVDARWFHTPRGGRPLYLWTADPT
jgi:hypothetical protein